MDIETIITASLLRSRKDLNCESASWNDETVDAYLICEMRDFLTPRFLSQNSRFLYPTDCDLANAVDNCGNATKYFVYKVNADFILLSLGLFDYLTKSKPTRMFQPTRDFFIGRGEAYYSFAATYCRSINVRADGVLAELSRNFEAYLRLLRHMKVEYLHLVNELGEAEEKHFLRGLEFEERLDKFLEKYSQWKKTDDENLKAQLLNDAVYLKKLNPEFRCDSLFEPKPL